MALDARIVEALRVLAAVVAAEGIDLVVIGAAVPLVLLDLRHGRPAGGRETRDVDVVVRVDSWEDFGRLRDNLLARGFRPVPTVPHRLLFGPDEHHAEVDLLPWSDRLAPDGTLRWPGSDVHMSTLGFAEAFACARPEPLANDLALPMVTLPASALLKLIAYRDRPADRALDLVDLVYYFERYEDDREGPGGNSSTSAWMARPSSMRKPARTCSGGRSPPSPGPSHSRRPAKSSPGSETSTCLRSISYLPRNNAGTTRLGAASCGGSSGSSPRA